ncbi:AsnC family protein [Thermocrispum municipale]|uniref:AsnC family protein n=1 Tax=Thermocrispum municipale TaxID=37926 RepID=UPI000404FFAD|nr:AsnC family protein [Thermocrispum municipale]
MAVTDPMDARLLAMLADMGKAAVHELAAKVGMDPREAASRLIALSGSGLPLLVGVECDPRGIRAAVAGAWHGPPSGAQPAQPYQPPSGGFPAQPQQGSGPHRVPSGPHRVPSGPHQVPSGPHQVPSGPYQVPASYQPQQPPGYQHPGVSQAHPVQAPPSPAPADPVISTWGPPQTAAWARGDQDSLAAQAASGPRTGRIGDALRSEGLEGEQLTVQLIEVQDPADYLFGAAGYRLEPGERAVVVHTEITNNGSIPYVSLPDNYLELITADGSAIAKAPVALTSRPPHKIGVQPGETLGGHTVYVLPESTRVTAVRWSPRPEPDHRTLTWTIED